MNFKECYGKYLAGTASPEEERFVEDQLRKSELLLRLIDEQEKAAAEGGIETPESKIEATETESETADSEGEIGVSVSESDSCVEADSETASKNKALDFDESELLTLEPSPSFGAQAKSLALNALNKGRNAISDKLKSASDKIRATDESEIKKVKKSFLKKTVMRTVIVSLIVIALIAGIAASVVFGVALTAANKDMMAEDEIKTAAINYARDEGLFAEGETFFVSDTENELELTLNLKKSYFECEVELTSVSGQKILLVVHTKTGRVDILDLKLNERDS